MLGHDDITQHLEAVTRAHFIEYLYEDISRMHRSHKWLSLIRTAGDVVVVVKTVDSDQITRRIIDETFWITHSSNTAMSGAPGHSRGTTTDQGGFDDTIYGWKIGPSTQTFTISHQDPRTHPNAPSVSILLRFSVEPNQSKILGNSAFGTGASAGGYLFREIPVSGHNAA